MPALSNLVKVRDQLNIDLEMIVQNRNSLPWRTWDKWKVVNPRVRVKKAEIAKLERILEKINLDANRL